MGKLLIIFGILIVVAGLILQYGGKIPFLGRLPGDISIEKKNFQVYIPITSSILISLLITLLLFVIRWFKSL